MLLSNAECPDATRKDAYHRPASYACHDIDALVEYRPVSKQTSAKTLSQCRPLVFYMIQPLFALYRLHVHV